MRFKAAFFDAGDTILYMDPPEEVFMALCEEQGLKVRLEDVRKGYKKADEYFAKYYDFRKSRQESRNFWSEFDAIILEACGIRDEEAARKISFGFERDSWFHPFPETSSVLKRMREKKGLTMAVVSNTTEEGPLHLKALGLAKYFDFLVTSYEVGYEKPDPRIFEVALERANVRPSEALHIGNLVKADVEGARGAGITPVLIDRNDAHKHVDCIRIESLEGIFDILFSEESKARDIQERKGKRK